MKKSCVLKLNLKYSKQNTYISDKNFHNSRREYSIQSTTASYTYFLTFKPRLHHRT